MRYEHIFGDYVFTFADEKDYLRCRLLFLEQFSDEASHNITFPFFIERELYKEGSKPAPNVNVLQIQRVAEIGTGTTATWVPGSYVSVNSNPFFDGELNGSGCVSDGDTFCRDGETYAMARLRHSREQRRSEQEQLHLEHQVNELERLRAMNNRGHIPPPIRFTAQDLQILSEEYIGDIKDLLPLCGPDDIKKEDTVGEEIIKKKTIFDMIDVD